MLGRAFVCGCWVCPAAPVLHATAAPTILWVCARLGGSLCREGAPPCCSVKGGLILVQGLSLACWAAESRGGFGSEEEGAFFVPGLGPG